MAAQYKDVLPTLEKDQVTHVEVADVEANYDTPAEVKDSASVPVFDIDEGFDPNEVKRITRKVDRHVIPILALMFTLSLIGGANLGLARAANNVRMDAELGTDIGNRFSIMAMIAFIPFIILELPSQLGLRRFGVKAWLGTSCLLWGLVLMCFGFVTSWRQLVALRALLGAFETPLFPGAAYLIGCWYPRKSMAVRNTAFYYGANTIASLGSILAYGLSHMDGLAGKSGWRWIFIIEGLITIVVAILAYIFLREFPDRATFLTPEERHIVTTRIERDRRDAVPDPMTLKKVGAYVRDFKPWCFGIMFLAANLGAFDMAYFLPTILQSMGFSNAEAQLLFAPPMMVALIPGFVLAWFCDRTKQRAAAVMFNNLMAVTGILMFSHLKPHQKAARYVGTFLCAAGSSGNVPLVISWLQSSIRSQSKRAYSSAVVVAFGGVGGILAGVIFLQREAAIGYPTGIWTTIGFNLLSFSLALALKIYLNWQNRQADRELLVLEGHPEFRYQA